MNGASKATAGPQAAANQDIEGSEAPGVIDMSDPIIRRMLADDFDGQPVTVVDEDTAGQPAAPAAAQPSPEGEAEAEPTPDDTPAEPEAQADQPDAKEKPAVPPEWQKSVDERIGKATAEAKAAKAEAKQKADELAALRLELETTRAYAAGEREGKHPAHYAESLEAFDQIVRDAYDEAEAAAAAAEKGGYSAKNGKTYTVEQLREIEATHRRFLTVEKDRVRAEIAARLQKATEVTAKHAAYQADIADVLAKTPALKTLPNGAELALQIALGRRVLAAKAKPAPTQGTPAPRAPAPPAPVGGGTGAGAPVLAGSRKAKPTTSDLENEYLAALESR